MRMKFRAAVLVATLSVSGVSGVAVAAPSSAAKAVCYGGTSSGECYTATSTTKKVKVVETVPLINKSSKTVTANCQFTKSLSFSQSVTATTSGTISASVKAGIFAGVEASVTSTVSTTLSQTASQATSAGGSVKLKPGQSMKCERIYSTIEATVKRVQHTSTSSKTTIYKTTVPSTFGVRFVD